MNLTVTITPNLLQSLLALRKLDKLRRGSGHRFNFPATRACLYNPYCFNPRTHGLSAAPCQLTTQAIVATPACGRWTTGITLPKPEPTIVISIGGFRTGPSRHLNVDGSAAIPIARTTFSLTRNADWDTIIWHVRKAVPPLLTLWIVGIATLKRLKIGPIKRIPCHFPTFFTTCVND